MKKSVSFKNLFNLQSLILIIIVLLAICCKPKEESDEFLIIKTTPNDVRSYPLSEVFTKGEMIKLETKDTCLIGMLMQLDMGDGYIVVNESSTRVLMFDTQGNFIRQIGSRGNGPQEYSGVSRVMVDENADMIIVASRNKLMWFDYDGNFVKSIPIHGNFMEYANIIDGKLYSVEKTIGREAVNDQYINRTKLYIYNEDHEIKDSIEIRQNKNSVQIIGMAGWPWYMSDLNSGLYFYASTQLPEPLLRDTLYRIEEDTLIPALKIDFSEVLSVDKSIDFGKALMSGEASQELATKIRNITLDNIYRTERFVFVEYGYKEKQDVLCYDLKEERPMTMHYGFEDDLFGTDSLATARPLDVKNDIFYFYKDGYEIAGQVDGITENSNPVLFMLKAKE